MSDRYPSRGGHHHHRGHHPHHRQPYSSQGPPRRGRPQQRGGRRGRGNHHSPGNRFTAQRENPHDAVWKNLRHMLSVVGEQENPKENLKLLVDVITGSNAELFLAYETTNTVSAKQHFGPLVIHLFDCIAALPQHTGVYATLAHLIHAKTITSQVPFAQRCMEYSVRIFGRDLDIALSSNHNIMDRLWAERRCHCIVRFWGIWWNTTTTTLEDASSRIVPFAIQKAPLETFPQLLQTLVTAAQMSRQHHKLLASLALTGANVMDAHEWKQRYVCQPIEELLEATVEAEDALFPNHGSDYAPGIGKYAILLLYEQWEKDDDEEEESRNSSACCDTFQDLLRISKLSQQNDSSLRLVRDAPEFEEDWKNLDSVNKLLRLDLFHHSELLLNILRNRLAADSAEATPAECPSIVPRLPIFGPPSSNEGPDEDDDDEEEDEGEAANPRLKAYGEKFTSIDRYFYGQMIRDIVFSYEPSVTDAGLEQGSAKSIAEHVWRLAPTSLEGMEYCILETLIPLMMTTYVSVPLIGMVIFELTKLEPGYFSAAIAIAIHTIVEDYMSNLVPQCRSILSSWFAFHLIQTDFQWPIAYWNHWAQDDDIWNSPSRKSFVTETLSRIAANVCSPRTVTEECLPRESKWSQELFKGASKSAALQVAPLVSDLHQAFSENQSFDTILKMLEDRSDLDTIGKVKVIVRGLLQPAVDEYDRQKSTIGNEMGNEQNSADRKSIVETLSLIANHCKHYLHTLIVGVTSEDDRSEDVGSAIVQELGDVTSWSDALLRTCIAILLDNELVTAQMVIVWQLDNFKDLPNCCWWDLVTFVIQYKLQSVPSSTEVPSSEANIFLADVMPFIVAVVRKLIVANETQETGHRIPHHQILLIEGLKVVICRTEKAFVELYSQNDWDKSSFNGPQLAQTNEIVGSPAVDLLQSCLQCM